MSVYARSCYEEGCKLERELATVTAQRDRLAEVMMAIEERYIDGCDTYEDWKFMGDTARAALHFLHNT
jgi:hypothetical protein